MEIKNDLCFELKSIIAIKKIRAELIEFIKTGENKRAKTVNSDLENFSPIIALNI
tara:strand:+ start:296 stop:460 length:165 start_codon:yes stop_codon:yes gene_type:complete